MTYVISDIHGCYDKYAGILEKISLKDSDKLYILGDVCDRGPDGIRILKDVMRRENVEMLMGNHDFYALVVLTRYLSGEVGEDDLDYWFSDGGKPTFEQFKKESFDSQTEILGFVASLAFHKEITVGSQKFLLAHTVPEEMDSPDDVTPHDYVWGECDYERKYFDDTVIVTGHTPTSFITFTKECRIWRGNNHIAIDCAAVFGHSLGCICLDTMEEYYC